MATIALDSQASREGAKPPISLHPAFPAVVALWFAALLGLGSLVVPVILLETAVDASGLAATVPAASPPLGMTARGLIALSAALLGAGIGLVIARRLAQVHAPAGKPRLTGAQLAEKRRPISAHDELGDEGLGDGGSSATRRRSLAMAEDARPSDYLSLAPLPGDNAYHDAIPAAGEEPPASWTAEDPLELCDIAMDAVESGAIPDGPEAPTFQQDPEMTDGQPALFPSSGEKERRLLERQSANGGAEAGGTERRPFARPTEAEPLPFAAPSLARRAPESETMPEVSAPDTSHDPQAQAIQSFDAPAETQDETPAPADWSSAPLEGLGLVQLVQRLGASLEKRREQAARAAAAGPVLPSREPIELAQPEERAALPVAAPEFFDAAPAEEAAQAMAAYFGRPAAAPEPEEPRVAAAPPAPPSPPLSERMAALAATSLEPEEDDEAADLAASFALPLRRSGTPAFQAEVTDAPGETDEGAKFGSLLSLGNPFASKSEEFVRVEEPPAADEGIQPTVVFPGREPTLRAPSAPAPAPQAPLAAGRMFDPPSAGGSAAAAAGSVAPKSPPADADEALRKALATLQRMSSSG